MLVLAYKKIIGKRSRTFFTCCGICISTVLFILSIYYLYISRMISKESFNQVSAEQRILFEEIYVGGVSYFDTPEGMLPIVKPITRSIISNILSHQGIEAISIGYELSGIYQMKIGESIAFSNNIVRGSDTEYDTFSKALVDLLQSTEDTFEPIVSGRLFHKGDKRSALISETTIKYLGLDKEDVVGEVISLVYEDHQYEITIVGVYSHLLTGSYRLDLQEISVQDIGEFFYEAELIFTKDLLEDISNFALNQPLYPSEVRLTVSGEAVIEPLTEMLYNNYDLRPNSDYKLFYAEFQQQVENDKLFLFFGGFILVISILMISNTIMMNLSEQKHLYTYYWFWAQSA